MHKIDGPGATAGNEFTEGDPSQGVAATVVKDDWLNAVQRELVNVVLDGGEVLDKLKSDQLLLAIKAVITAQTEPKMWRKNLIINGNFDIWQRGISFAGVSDEYTADRWVANDQTGIMTVTQEAFTPGQTDVPNEPTFFMKLKNTVPATGIYNVIGQRIEDVRRLAGKTAILSFYARMGSPKTFDVLIRQIFGIGGSSLVTVETVAVNITTSFQRFEIPVTFPSISGKTIGADSLIDFTFREQSFTTFDLDIAQFQLEVGTVSSNFEERTYSEEMALCQRYFQTISAVNMAVGAAGVDFRIGTMLLPIVLRAPPAVTIGTEFGLTTAAATSPFVDRFTASGTGISANTAATLSNVTLDSEL